MRTQKERIKQEDNEESPSRKLQTLVLRKNLQKDPAMAVQLMPESAVCLLMVSLGGVEYFRRCLLSVFASFFFSAVLCPSSLSPEGELSPH